jgi:hypothetical protein
MKKMNGPSKTRFMVVNDVKVVSGLVVKLEHPSVAATGSVTIDFNTSRRLIGDFLSVSNGTILVGSNRRYKLT